MLADFFRELEKGSKGSMVEKTDATSGGRAVPSGSTGSTGSIRKTIDKVFFGQEPPTNKSQTTGSGFNRDRFCAHPGCAKWGTTGNKFKHGGRWFCRAHFDRIKADR